MSKEYVSQVHCFVEFDFQSRKWDDKMPMSIVLHTGDFVWVSSCYADEFPEDCKQVGDGRSNGYDRDGNCIHSVPVSHVTRYWTDEEVDDLAKAIAVDERLLRYAR